MDRPDPAPDGDASRDWNATDLYGESFADVYDDWYGEVSDVAATVALLTELAPGGRVLELGVGTGRLAIPLAEEGATVTGIDSSTAMLARLAENDPHSLVTAIQGDMATFAFETRFDAAFVAYNTLFNLTTFEAQQRCFRSVAEALRPEGHFVIETFVPADSEGSDRVITPTMSSNGGIVLTATIRRSAEQTVTGQHIELGTDGSVRLRPWTIRYSTLDEIDEMASLAGMTKVSRWSDWAKRPFADDSSRHVTVYRLRS